MYDVVITSSPVFSFQVIRKSTGIVLFDSSLGGLTLTEQFLQIGVKLPSDYLYGLGEHQTEVMRHEMDWEILGMFNNDHSTATNAALYGTQPYYMVIEDEEGNTHSVLFMNSNAQEVQMTPAPGLIYRTIGK